MSTARNRYNSRDVSKGTAVFNTGVPIAGSGGVIRIGSYYAEDIVRKRSEGDNQYFKVEHYTQTGGRLNGNSPSAKFTNFYGTVYDNWNNFPHHTNLPGSPSDAWVANSAAARSNPSRPLVDMPAEILQMGDLIGLLRNAGKSIIKRWSNQHLVNQFAILPLFRMSSDLFKFAKKLDSRLKEMQRLQSDHGLRRTMDYGGYSASGSYSKVIQSQGVFIQKNFFANTHEEVSAHARWIPSGDFRSLDAHNLRILTNRVMLGLTRYGNPNIDLATLWELIPWSWFIDWGGNVSQYFKANRNTVNATFAGVSVMRDIRTTYDLDAGSVAGVSYEACHIERINKSRVRVPLTPYATFPLLDERQMGIVAALAVLRA